MRDDCLAHSGRLDVCCFHTQGGGVLRRVNNGIDVWAVREPPIHGNAGVPPAESFISYPAFHICLAFSFIHLALAAIPRFAHSRHSGGSRTVYISAGCLHTSRQDTRVPMFGNPQKNPQKSFAQFPAVQLDICRKSVVCLS